MAPIAVALNKLEVETSAREPIAVLLDPVLILSAEYPIAVLSLPEVLFSRE
jgi:hypothetical protein